MADQPGGPTTRRDFSANANAQYGTVSALFQRPEGGVRPFGLVGMGVYYRPAEITTPGAGYVPGYCDPWWYICYPGGWVEVDNIIGERSSTDFGMTFGGGVRFGAFYAELRYHYIWGPTLDPQSRPDLPVISPPLTDLAGKSANGQFLADDLWFPFLNAADPPCPPTSTASPFRRRSASASSVGRADFPPRVTSPTATWQLETEN